MKGFSVSLSLLFLLSSPVSATPPICALDAPLSTAAAELLLTDAPPTASQLTAAVRAAGSEAVALRALYLPANDPARIDAWLSELRAKADAPLICGDARTARSRLVIASSRAGSLEIDNGHVRGTLAPGFTRPELVVRSATGEVTRLALTADALAHGIPLDPDWRASQVQITAWNASGPRPIAERTLGDPSASDAALELFPETPLDARGVSDVIARLRERHARHDLRRNRLAEQIAEGHARAVCAEGRVVHALEPGVDPETRVARAGLRARLVGETVARAKDPSAALQALWHSPSHALTLLEPRFTDVGVGLATDSSQRTCLVVLLLSWPRPVPRAQ